MRTRNPNQFNAWLYATGKHLVLNGIKQGAHKLPTEMRTYMENAKGEFARWLLFQETPEERLLRYCAHIDQILLDLNDLGHTRQVSVGIIDEIKLARELAAHLVRDCDQALQHSLYHWPHTDSQPPDIQRWYTARIALVRLCRFHKRARRAMLRELEKLRRSKQSLQAGHARIRYRSLRTANCTALSRTRTALHALFVSCDSLLNVYYARNVRLIP